MDYFDLYKSRVGMIGSNESENRVINMCNSIERSFSLDHSYRKAVINFKQENTIDCRFSEDENNLFLKYFLFKPSDDEKVIEGMYLTTKEGVFLLSEINMDNIYKKGEAYICNQKLKIKGIEDIWCFADNTSYGVKGSKDNGYYKESDKKLKIKVQANNNTLQIKEGFRFLFGSDSIFTTSEDKKNEWIAYEVIAKDFTVLKNQYVLELAICDLQPGKDDFVNGIAWNNIKIVDENKENITLELIPNIEQIQVGESIVVDTIPKDAELICTNGMVDIENIGQGEYKITGIDSSNYAEIQLIKNKEILITQYILVY